MEGVQADVHLRHDREHEGNHEALVKRPLHRGYQAGFQHIMLQDFFLQKLDFFTYFESE